MYNAKRPTQSELPSPAKLLRSTILAAVGAAAILVAIVLPSEYGIDPTGAGRVLGLKDMGDTKTQLAEEAEADRMAAEVNVAAVAPAPSPAPAPAPDLSGLYQRIDALEGAVRDLTQTLEVSRTASVAPAPEEQIAAAAAAAAATPAPGQAPTAIPEPTAEMITGAEQQQALVAADPDPQAEAPNQHEASFTLNPGQGIEIKLVMKKGAQASFAWASEGGSVNFDTHGDGEGDLKISYEKGRGVQSDDGTIVAEFDGNHGWFWRNRNQEPVTLSLRTAGDYSAIKGLPN
jgi:hypothetical protein